MGFTLGLIVFLVFCMVIPTSHAYVIDHVENASNFDIPAPSGLHIVQIDTDRMHTPGTQIYTLYDDQGGIYTLQVAVTSVLNTYWDCHITLIRPDGTTDTKDLPHWGIAWDYKTTIQYAIANFPNNTYIIGLDAQLYIGLNPEINASFGVNTANPSQYVFFSRAAATSTFPTTWNVYLVNDYEKQMIQENNVAWNVENLVTSAFSWTWDGIIWFLNKIPVVGPYFAEILGVLGVILAEIWWWFNFLVIENWDIVLVILECVIMGHAIIATNQQGKATFGTLFSTLLNDHVALVNGALWFVKTMIWLIKWAIDIVTQIVQAINPL